MITVASLILGVACGFGTTVWCIIAGWNWTLRHRWLAFWYTQLAVAYVVCTVIIIGRLFHYFDDIPRGFSLFLIAPIFAIPPAIQFIAWLKARKMISDFRDGRIRRDD